MRQKAVLGMYRSLSLSVIASVSIAILSTRSTVAQVETSFSPSPDAIGRCRAGSLLGQSGVSCTGAATYSIPIEIPPGTNHAEPALSLAYNSQAGDSLLGMGWSISGLSSITRCAANMALDGFRGGIQYDKNDRFCLDGQRLIPITDIVNGEREYRTEPDTFARVKSYRTTESGADYFTVEAKTGQIMEYGYTADSRIEALGVREVRVWAVNKLSDQLGNYLRYEYIESRVTGEYRLTKIKYSGNENAGTLPYNSVVFCYQARELSGVEIDQTPFYQGGYPVTTTKLLGKIKTCANTICTCLDEGRGEFIREYQLRYQPGPATNRWQLKTVQVRASDDSFLPPTVMSWSDEGVTDLSGNKESGTQGDSKWADGFGENDTNFIKTRQTLYADAFFPNISAVRNAPDNASLAVNSVFLGMAVVSFIANPPAAAISWVVRTVYVFFKNWISSKRSFPKGKIGDVDGDGKADIIGFAKRAVSKKNQGTEYVWLSTKSAGRYYFSKIDAWKTEPLHRYRRGEPQSDEVKVADFDGNGQADVIELDFGETRVYQSNGVDSFDYRDMYFDGVNSNNSYALGDFDADGRADIAYFNPNINYDYILLARDGRFNHQPNWGLCEELGLVCDDDDSSPLEDLLLADVNGDNKTDIIKFVPVNDRMQAHVWFTNRDATGWTPESPVISDIGLSILRGSTDAPDLIQPGDFNGDGKVDLAIFKSSQTGGSCEPDDTNGDGVSDKDDVKICPAFLHIYYSTGRATGLNQTFVEQPDFAELPNGRLAGKKSPFALKYPGHWPSRQPVSFLTRLVDLNGDGRTDLINFDPWDEHGAHVMFSTGTRLRDAFVWSGGGLIDEMMLGDADGDGRADVINFMGGDNDKQIHVTLSNKYPFPDLLTSVTDGFGAKTQFEYKPLSDDSVYRGNTSLAGHDSETFNFRGALYVVSKHSTANGLVEQPEALYEQRYTYRGAKSSRSFGFLGFRYIDIEDPQLLKTETIKYEQKNPLMCHVEGKTTRTEHNPHIMAYERFKWEVISGDARGGAPHVIKLVTSTEVENELDGRPIKRNFTRYAYDDYNNVTNQEVFWGLGGLLAEQTSHTYYNDENSWILGLPTSTTIEREQPYHDVPRVIERQFDLTTGLIKSSTEHLSQGRTLVTTYGYENPFGQINRVATSGSDISSRETEIHYDSVGRSVQWIENYLGQRLNLAMSPKFGRILRATDPNGITTSWEYDGFGREKNEFGADGTVTETTFCPEVENDSIPPLARHWMKVTTSAVSDPSLKSVPDRVIFFDEIKRPIRSLTVGFEGTPVLTDSIYNAALQLEQQTIPYSGSVPTAWTEFFYDRLSRPVTITAPHGASTYFRYDREGKLEPNPFTGFSERLLWRRVTRVDPLGHKTEYMINRLDQVNQVNHRTNSNELLSTVTYDYDAFDNLIGTADSSGNVTSRSYQDDRMVEMRDLDMGNWRFVYDVLGQLKRMTDGATNVSTFEYDALGRMKSRTEPVGQVSTWTYDAVAYGIGRLESLEGPNGFLESYEYDSAGRPRRATTRIPGQSPLYVTDLTYDEAGRLDVLSYPGPANFGTRNIYNSAGYLSSVETEFSPSLLWRANSVNAFGEVVSQTQGNGVDTQFTYDEKQNTLRGIDISYQAQPIKRLAYSYNDIDTLLERRDLTLMPDQETIEMLSYDDQLDRLTGTSTDIIDHVNQRSIHLDDRNYRYDPIGNMLFKSDVSSFNPNYVYGQEGRYPHAASSVCEENQCYLIRYDGNGNMLSGPDLQNDSNRDIYWFTFNKPMSLLEGSEAVIFEYDPYRNKVKQDTYYNLSTEKIEYIGTLLERSDPVIGNVEYRHFIYGPSRQPLAVYNWRTDNTSEIRYFHYDNLGSLEVITNVDGDVIERLSFDPHGQRRNPDWTPNEGNSPIPSITTRGFTGHEHIDGFGVIDMKGRMYDPKLGRFASADPFVADPLLSESFNRYSYVYNNPVTFVDPTGFQVNTGVIQLSRYGDDLVRGIVEDTVKQSLFHNAGVSFALQGAAALGSSMTNQKQIELSRTDVNLPISSSVRGFPGRQVYGHGNPYPERGLESTFDDLFFEIGGLFAWEIRAAGGIYGAIDALSNLEDLSVGSALSFYFGVRGLRRSPSGPITWQDVGTYAAEKVGTFVPLGLGFPDPSASYYSGPKAAIGVRDATTTAPVPIIGPYTPKIQYFIKTPPGSRF